MEQRELVDMIRDRFTYQDEMLKDLVTSLKEHIKTDQEYWKKIDVQQGQINLLKAIGGSSVLTAFGAYIWSKFH